MGRNPSALMATRDRRIYKPIGGSMKTLREMPDEAKLAYARILAALISADKTGDPVGFAELYLLAVQLDLSIESRQVLRESLAGGEGKLPDMAQQLAGMFVDEERKVVGQ